MNVSTGFSHSTGVASGIGGLDTVENQSGYMTAYGPQNTNPLPHSYNASLDSIPVYPVAPELDVGADENGGDCFVCEECSKQFLRHCDLNKHLRTHSRPFKCTVESCKYHGLGWPTEKELERHYNDKHETAPQIFTCSFQPCQYTSKRESNLKQHMEKTHGWNYVRSRASRLYRDDGRPPLADMTQMATPSRHFGDFDLFPDGTTPSIPTPTSATRYGPAPGQDISDSYVPWASPPTREEDISQCLRSVASVIDPRLAAQQGHVHEGYVRYEEGGGGPQNLAMQPHSVGAVGVKLPPSPSVYAMEPRDWYSVPSFVDIKLHETTKPSTGRAAGASGSVAAGPPSTTHSAHGTAPHSAGYTKQEEDSDEDNSEDGDDDDDDGEPPAKRPRMESHDNFGDDQMPCPFRLSDPAFFDRNNKEKFSPCHTKHKDISTIVRHLSRPAHKLEVDERSISSFDIELEEGRTDPQAGLCRKCWKRFRDRDEFRRHLAQACTKVSKGKREKFELLLSTFCPGPEPAAAPAQHRHPSSAQGDAIPRIGSDAPYAGLYPPGVGDLATPVEAPSVASDIGSHRHVMVKSEEAPPDRQEFQALSERVNRLERENRETRALLRSFLHQTHRRSGGGGGGGTTPSPRPPVVGTTGRTNPLSEFPGGYLGRFSDEEPAGSAGDRDSASLLGGMNSRSTDVDREALPHEAQRTLSGLSSSSDKSSVRHVPLNARFAPPGTTASQTRRLRSGGEPPRTPPPKLSTSLDSGYGGSSTKDNNNNSSSSRKRSSSGAAAAAAAELGTVAEHGEGAQAPANVNMPESQPLPGQEFLREPGIDDFREAGIDVFDDVWPEGK